MDNDKILEIQEEYLNFTRRLLELKRKKLEILSNFRKKIDEVKLNRLRESFKGGKKWQGWEK